MKKTTCLSAVLLLTAAGIIFSGETTAEKPTDPLRSIQVALQKEIRACLQNRQFLKAETGIHIVSVDGNQPLFQFHPDKLFIPASVTKIITSGICLDRFGVDFTFQTQILIDGKLEGGALNGNLYLKGQGDPGLMVTHLESAAEEMKKEGIKEIRGDLIYDNSFLDEEFPRFPPNARHLYAPPDALTLNYNWIILGLDTGPPARLWTIPGTGYARLDYQVTVSNSDLPGKPSMTYRKMPWGDHYAVRGKISDWDRRYNILRLCVTRPGLFAATIFKESLGKYGITCESQIKKGITPPGARVIKVIKTERMKDIVRDLNLESNNVVAELINKNLGAYFVSVPGTREKGLSLMRQYCREIIGINGFSLQDSSGLSAENRFSPSQVTRALNHFYRKMGRNYAETLAPQGHHAHALSPVPPRGMLMLVKSGTLPASGVNTVAGYISIEQAKKSYSFAILVNRMGSDQPVYSGTYTIPLLTALVRAFDSVF